MLGQEHVRNFPSFWKQVVQPFLRGGWGFIRLATIVGLFAFTVFLLRYVLVFFTGGWILSDVLECSAPLVCCGGGSCRPAEEGQGTCEAAGVWGGTVWSSGCPWSGVPSPSLVWIAPTEEDISCIMLPTRNFKNDITLSKSINVRCRELMSWGKCFSATIAWKG